MYITTSRTKKIMASKKAIFEVISDLARFSEFEPWGLAEPEASVTHSTPETGVGAFYEWKGNVIGAGKLTIEEVDSEKGMNMNIDFISPNSKGNKVLWNLEEVEHDGVVSCNTTWSLISKLPWFFLPMKNYMTKMFEEMIGTSYELGLERLAHLINPESHAVVNINIQPSVEMQDIHYVGVAFQNLPAEKIGKTCEEVYPQIGAFLHDMGICPEYAFLAYTYYHKQTHNFDGMVCCAISKPLDSKVIAEQNATLKNTTLSSGTIAGAYSAKIIHTGFYDTLQYAWGVAIQRVRKLQKKYHRKLPFIEIYRTMPTDTDAGVTEILIPIDKHKESALLHKG